MAAKKEPFLNNHDGPEVVNENVNGVGDNKMKTKSQGPDAIRMQQINPRTHNPLQSRHQV
jgi:hypothetical protein